MIVIKALITSIPGIANVSCFFLCIFIVFGILGGTLFRGEGKPYCSDHGISTQAACTGFYWADRGVSGRSEPRKWVVTNANFDNMYTSMLTLLEVATLEGWSAYMHFFLNRPGGSP